MAKHAVTSLTGVLPELQYAQNSKPTACTAADLFGHMWLNVELLTVTHKEEKKRNFINLAEQNQIFPERPMLCHHSKISRISYCIKTCLGYSFEHTMYLYILGYMFLLCVLNALVFVCVCAFCSCPVDSCLERVLLNDISLAMLGSFVFLCGPVFANLCAQTYICVAD